MSYRPKEIKCKINSENITEEEIKKDCMSKDDIPVIKEFYKKIDGAVLYLSLWRYDNHKKYHVSGWDNDMDKQVMESIFILEKAFGAYDNFKEFEKDWKNEEYDPCAVTTLPKCVVEELEVMCEELKEE